MKLSSWAKKQGIHYNTAKNWFRTGKMPVHAYKTATGTIMVEDAPAQALTSSKVVVYGRVSSSNKKEDLARQIERCLEYCRAKGYEVQGVYKETASGRNDNRPKFWKMLDSSPSLIVVEHKDRLTRFGFRYIEGLLAKQGCKIEVLNRDASDEQDLMKDMIAIVTSFCCRLYGARRGQNKARAAKEVITSDNG